MKDRSSDRETRRSILVVEDDRSLREGLALNLRLHGYNVLTAANGEQGMQMAFDRRADLIILDIMMPGWSGLDILDELRKREENVPVLILSARSTTRDKVNGLGIGADDYMTKPFDLPELIARIEVMLRRQRSKEKEDEVVSAGDITLNRTSRTLQVHGRSVELSAKEFDILYLMASSPGRVFTRQTILERVWGWDYEGTTRTVDNFVAGLRRKLQMAGDSSKLIKTVPKAGYKFDVP